MPSTPWLPIRAGEVQGDNPGYQDVWKRMVMNFTRQVNSHYFAELYSRSSALTLTNAYTHNSTSGRGNQGLGRGNQGPDRERAGSPTVWKGSRGDI